MSYVLLSSERIGRRRDATRAVRRFEEWLFIGGRCGFLSGLSHRPFFWTSLFEFMR